MVPIPKWDSVMTSKWIYKIKHAAYRSIEKHKEIFMVCGFSLKEGVDYEEKFAPIERYNYIIYILALVALMKWKIHLMDVKTTFLNGVVEEEVYIEKPLGFKTHDKKTHVCKLKKALYELKRHPWDSTYNYMRRLNIT